MDESRADSWLVIYCGMFIRCAFLTKLKKIWFIYPQCTFWFSLYFAKFNQNKNEKTLNLQGSAKSDSILKILQHLARFCKIYKKSLCMMGNTCLPKERRDHLRGEYFNLFPAQLQEKVVVPPSKIILERLRVDRS